jgi:hypothetical protein
VICSLSVIRQPDFQYPACETIPIRRIISARRSGRTEQPTDVTWMERTNQLPATNPPWPAHLARRGRVMVIKAPDCQSSSPASVASYHFDSQALVDFPLAFMSHHLDAPDLARVCPVRAAVCLQVQARLSISATPGFPVLEVTTTAAAAVRRAKAGKQHDTASTTVKRAFPRCRHLHGGYAHMRLREQVIHMPALRPATRKMTTHARPDVFPCTPGIHITTGRKAQRPQSSYCHTDRFADFNLQLIGDQLRMAAHQEIPALR